MSVEEEIEDITQKFLYKNRGKGLGCNDLVVKLQSTLNENFDFKVVAELSSISDKCVIIYSEERDFEEIVKYIGKQVKT
jgi:hypothetical protein